MRIAETDEQVLAHRFIATGIPYESSSKTVSALVSNLQKHQLDEALVCCEKLNLDFCKFMQMQSAAEAQIIEAKELALVEEKELSKVADEIRECEEALEHAKDEKKFKDRCDGIAKKILNLKSRVETEQRIEQLEAEIVELEEKIRLRREFVLAQRQVYESLFSAIDSLEFHQQKHRKESGEENGNIDVEMADEEILESVREDDAANPEDEEEEEGAIVNTDA
jgi:hypothetical protein